MDENFVTPEYCSNCGAKTISEICPNCGASTGITYDDISLKYPSEKCREANVPFFKIISVAIIGFPFAWIGFEFFSITTITDDLAGNIINFLFFLFLMSPELIAIGTFLTSIINNINVKMYGIDIEAIVYGYEADKSLQVMGMYAQTIKLIINDATGTKIIFYRLNKLNRPYEVNSKLKLRVYNDIYLIKGRL